MEFDLTQYTPDIRKLKDMGTVLYDKEWAQTADPELELYYMYRGLKEDGNMRYDITVVNPVMLGQEFNKTKGHTHISNHGEEYIVLEGKALYLMQKKELSSVK